MSGPRLNTVYDFSSLRLHPNGSRVRQNPQNSQLRVSRTARDSRGNWIARDAGGLGSVGKYRKVREEEEGEEINVEGTGTEDLETREKKGKGKSKADQKSAGIGNPRKHDLRPAKRQKFSHDFDFLAKPLANTLSQPEAQALPSSDLLKCIHYFASQYYHERGHLFNASRMYRQQKKQKKLMLEEEEGSVSPSPTPHDEESEDDTPVKKPRRGGRVKGGKVNHRKDMYKRMDGSALMAIGMLLQEYINDLLEVRVPDGWADGIHDVDSDSEDELGGEDELLTGSESNSEPEIGAQGGDDIEGEDGGNGSQEDEDMEDARMSGVEEDEDIQGEDKSEESSEDNDPTGDSD